MALDRSDRAGSPLFGFQRSAHTSIEGSDLRRISTQSAAKIVSGSITPDTKRA